MCMLFKPSCLLAITSSHSSDQVAIAIASRWCHKFHSKIIAQAPSLHNILAIAIITVYLQQCSHLEWNLVVIGETHTHF